MKFLGLVVLAAAAGAMRFDDPYWNTYQDWARFHERMIDQCDVNSTTLIDKAKHDLEICTSRVEAWAHIYRRRGPFSNGEPKTEYFSKLDSNAMKKCVDEYLLVISPCIGNEMKKDLKTFSHNFMDYLSHDNGQLLHNFFYNLDENKSGNCSDVYVSHHKIDAKDCELNLKYGTKLSNDCRNVRTYAKCWSTFMKPCSEESANILATALNKALEGTTCNHSTFSAYPSYIILASTLMMSVIKYFL